jgi:hypothetical protein
MTVEKQYKQINISESINALIHDTSSVSVCVCKQQRESIWIQTNSKEIYNSTLNLTVSQGDACACMHASEEYIYKDITRWLCHQPCVS